MKKRLRKLMYRFMPQSPLLAAACECYADFVHGECVGHPKYNGEYRFLRRFLPECKVCFDVGANKGEWTSEALRFNPNLTIHAFEPTESTFKVLAGHDWPASVHLNQSGLSDAAGTQTIYRYQNPKLNSVFRRDGLRLDEQSTEEQIRLTTLDAYVADQGVERIDLLKIDVEGLELKVLKGGTEVFRRRQARLVQLEYGGTYIDSRTLLKDVFEFAAEVGYRVYVLHTRGWHDCTVYRPELENFKFKNLILTPVDAPLPPR